MQDTPTSTPAILLLLGTRNLMFWGPAINRAEESTWPAGSPVVLFQPSRPRPVTEIHICEPSSYQGAPFFSADEDCVIPD